MAHALKSSPGPTSTSRTWPTAPSGWFALGVALVGMGSSIVLPIITTHFRDDYPVTDTVVMPIVGLVLVTLAAIINVLTLWLGKQRSLLNVIAATLTVAASLSFGLFVIGEGLSGA